MKVNVFCVLLVLKEGFSRRGIRGRVTYSHMWVMFFVRVDSSVHWCEFCFCFCEVLIFLLGVCGGFLGGFG